MKRFISITTLLFLILGNGPICAKIESKLQGLVYSSYFGGNGYFIINDIKVDKDGNTYIVANTTSTDLAVTQGAFMHSAQGGPDVFVAKFSPAGELIYATYLGGNSDDGATALVLDEAGNAYIVGATWSTNFPTTAGALDENLSGGRDAYVVLLSADGKKLLAGTYLGGNNWDYGNGVARDSRGNIYVTGFTHGSFPITPGVVQEKFGGMGDGFLTKLTPDLGKMIYSTYVGGNSWEGTNALFVANDFSVYLTNGTSSTDFPTTEGAFDRVCDNCGPNYHGNSFVMKLNPDATKYIYSTLIGGSTAHAFDDLWEIVVDKEGNANLVGSAMSDDFPVTDNALQKELSGAKDIVIVRLNADGSKLLYSSYLGGTGEEGATDLIIDKHGNFIIYGATNSTDLPLVHPVQSELNGGYDAFLMKFSPKNNTLLFSSYLGGSKDELFWQGQIWPYSHIAAFGNQIVMSGLTTSKDFPVTEDAFQFQCDNSEDACGFISKIRLVK
jgi:hypothetical protein